jgi:hypothetical protein
MRFSSALLIGALAQGTLATKINDYDAKADTAATVAKNPCETAVLSVDPKIVTDIDVVLGQKTLIPAQIRSKPDCPFTCSIKLDKNEIEDKNTFNKATGDWIAYPTNAKLVGTDISFTITCQSDLSKSTASYSSWVSVLAPPATAATKTSSPASTTTSSPASTTTTSNQIPATTVSNEILQ